MPVRAGGAELLWEDVAEWGQAMQLESSRCPPRTLGRGLRPIDQRCWSMCGRELSGPSLAYRTSRRSGGSRCSPSGRAFQTIADRLTAALVEAGAGVDTDLYFICRSGGRSQLAAETMASAGYGRCHNVSDGFEGPLDADRHRGRLAGWKSAGLPWMQG